MLEPESVEEYFEWCLLHPSENAHLDWDASRSRHSELLGYLRWCKLKREETK
jgi:hypothetical protein